MQHPSLRIYKPQITRLPAHLSSFQQNSKIAQTTLKRILTFFLVPSGQFHIVYSSHLAYISVLSSSCDVAHWQHSSFRELRAIRDLHRLATRNSRASTVGVLELCNLVHNEFWNDSNVGAFSQKVDSESLLGLNSVSEQ